MEINYTRWLKDESVTKAINERLSMIVLANNYPHDCALLFLELLQQSDTFGFLSSAEQRACTYYQEYLNIRNSITTATNASIRNVAALTELKSRLHQDGELDYGWKLTIQDDFHQPFALRDTIAKMYEVVRRRQSFVDVESQADSTKHA